jgi:hypothetical protein
MDSYDKLTQGVSKYIVPCIFFVVGIILLITGLTTNAETKVVQSNWFVYAGIVLTLMGFLMGLHIGGFLKKKVALVLVPVLIGLCVWFSYMNYASVKARIDLGNRFDLYEDNVKQALLDIKDIEVTYKKSYYKYTNNQNELLSYLQNGTVRYVTSLCDERQTPGRRITFPEADSLGYDPNTEVGNSMMESMDDGEATKLGLVTRDTVLIPVFDYVFGSKDKDGNYGVPFHICDCPDTNGNFLYDVTVAPVSNPTKRRYAFDMDSLWVKRGKFEGAFELMTADLGDSALAKPVFTVYDSRPFDPFTKRDTLRVGKLNKHNTEGNWRD